MNADTDGDHPENQRVVMETKLWLERAVIGLNLCPFAKTVFTKDRIRYVASAAATPEALCAQLHRELLHLQACAPEEVETTLLIHPGTLIDFLDYNDFLDVADALIDELDLTGEIQIASFHPRYQFAGTRPDDIENYSNRSPYPMLQLLRELSIEKASESYPDASAIYERNIQTLKELGLDGLDKLKIFPKQSQLSTLQSKKKI